MSKPKKRTKTVLSVEKGVIVHPSSKEKAHHHVAQPINHVPAPVQVQRTDRKGNITHVNGLQVESK